MYVFGNINYYYLIVIYLVAPLHWHSVGSKIDWWILTTCIKFNFCRKTLNFCYTIKINKEYGCSSS